MLVSTNSFFNKVKCVVISATLELSTNTILKKMKCVVVSVTLEAPFKAIKAVNSKKRASLYDQNLEYNNANIKE